MPRATNWQVNKLASPPPPTLFTTPKLKNQKLYKNQCSPKSFDAFRNRKRNRFKPFFFSRKRDHVKGCVLRHTPRFIQTYRTNKQGIRAQTHQRTCTLQSWCAWNYLKNCQLRVCFTIGSSRGFAFHSETDHHCKPWSGGRFESSNKNQHLFYYSKKKKKKNVG